MKTMAVRARRAGMSPEALDGLARAFTRDGYVIVEDVLSSEQLRVLRDECDAVMRRYARLGGPPAPRLRDSSAPPEAEAEAEVDADPLNASLEWLSRDFGCILEVPGCCGCCPPSDSRTGGYRSPSCEVTRAAVDATLAPDGPLGALARALLSSSARPKFPASSESSLNDEKTPPGRPTGPDTDPEMCLFNDQYIVKPPSSCAARFAWHRDSQWCDEAAERGASTLGKRKSVADDDAVVSPKRVPYVSLWTALDDVDALNGCVRVLPYPSGPEGGRGHPTRAKNEDARETRKAKTLFPEKADALVDAHATNAARYPHSSARLNLLSNARWRENLCAEEREKAADAFRDVRVCAVRAGGVLCMSDRVLHCSGPNASRAVRRAWMPQFSARAIRHRDGDPTALAVPAASIRARERRENARPDDETRDSAGAER